MWMALRCVMIPIQPLGPGGCLITISNMIWEDLIDGMILYVATINVCAMTLCGWVDQTQIGEMVVRWAVAKPIRRDHWLVARLGNDSVAYFYGSHHRFTGLLSPEFHALYSQLNHPERVPAFHPQKPQPIKFAILCSGAFGLLDAVFWLTMAPALKQVLYRTASHTSRYMEYLRTCQLCTVSWCYITISYCSFVIGSRRYERLRCAGSENIRLTKAV